MKRNTTICEVCGRAISNSNYLRHVNSHFKQKVDDGKYHVDHDGLECKFCGKECKSLISLTQHERLCPKNQGRNYISYTRGHEAWNKGLTKETDERVLRNSNSLSKTLQKKVAEGWLPGFASSEFWTDEQRHIQSERKKSLYREHPEKHPNRILASNNYRTYPEQIVYDYLQDRGIEFIEKYETAFYDNKRFVDFYLPTYNLYIEVDGEFWHKECKDKDFEKDKYALEIQGINTLRVSAKEHIISVLDSYL